MRSFSPRMFPNTVAVTPWEAGRSGGGSTRDPAAAITWQASVQPAKAGRVILQGTSRAEVEWVAYFPGDPGIKVKDTITWSGRTLSALGPAKPEAGRLTLWSVDCRETR